MVATVQNQQFRNLLLTWPEKAVRFIYEAYYENLVIISQRLTNDIISAEDVVQAVFAEVWHNHTRFAQNEEQAIEYYLVAQVKKKSRAVYREKIRSDSELIRKAREKSDFPTDTDVLRIIDSECLKLIVDRFPKYEQECFQLRYRRNMELEEIAGLLNKSHRFVERKLVIVKRKIRRYHWVLA